MMTQVLDEARADLVTANQILHGQGILDAFGHVSARHPEREDRFLISRNRAPSLVRAADILEFDLDGVAIDPEAPPSYLERFIHAAVYRARADVGAVVHSHSRSVLPFGISTGEVLRPVSHMAGFLGAGAPVFEIRSVAGDTSDLLIRDISLGRALAETLGDATVVLMRGHGATTVGRDVRQAVFHSVYTEMNAQVQAQALAIGAPTYLTVEEARAAAVTNDGQIPRAWDYWRGQAERRG
jgi:ribulose-5-phosphate 4-epimerase/fuculose-1-phosphate aldolase